ncbi:serine hydrolase domain-containing protein [Brevibacillus choshinensis]|uniref:serine hydrolase domain-containing protein n=1 Tax=Brevibacillus choshinensis TaxID=54911 RepID=UPI002E22958C|nr:serine hydrolase [Brevibacillus choshinensis]
MTKNAELLSQIEAKMKENRIPGAGIAVFIDGQLEWADGLGVMEAGTNEKIRVDTPFHACSMSKMVTAIGVLRLVQEGVLDLDEDVNHYLISWRVPEHSYNQKVTLRNLLAHHAGFVDPKGSFDCYQSGDSLPTRMKLLTGLTRYNPVPLQVSYEPDSQFSYSDAGYCLIEQIMEDVTGNTFPAVMDQLVLAPLGFTHSFFWECASRNGGEVPATASKMAGHDPTGTVVTGKRAYYPYMASSGYWTTPTEMAKLTLQLTASYKNDPNALLHSDLGKSMLTGHENNKYVGLGVFLQPDQYQPYLVSKGWGIGFQCMMIAFPRMQSGVVVMTNSDPGKPQEESFVGEVIRMLSHQYHLPNS